MIETAVFNEETGKWYRNGESWKGVQADTYLEAFEKLYSRSIQIPPPQRAPRRNQEAE